MMAHVFWKESLVNYAVIFDDWFYNMCVTVEETIIDFFPVELKCCDIHHGLFDKLLFFLSENTHRTISAF